MGALPNYRTLGLMWVFGLLFCALLLQANTQVSADSKVDSDLVFDSIDAANLRNRIARGSSSFSYPESSQPVEEHWLSRTVNRIKRSIGSIFSKNEQEPISHHKAHPDHHEKTLPQHQSHDINDNDHVQLNRKHRQLDDYDSKDGSPARPNDNDDEDLDGSGKGGSGEPEEENTPAPTTTTKIPSTYPRYYRFTFTAQEYYTDDFNDRNSNTFQDMANRIRRSVNELFERQPGHQTATVISIEKVENEPFQVRTTVDLESVGWYEANEIRRIIHDELQDTHRLGVTAVPDNFVFRAFEDARPSCEVTQYPCKSQQCVDQSARCNGIRDCNDNSDEEGCPTPRPSEPIATERVNYDVSITRPTTQAPVTTPSPPTTTPIPDFGSGDGEEQGRADDITRCDDGNGTYYGDQRCDGSTQCQDGSDERNCPPDASRSCLLFGGGFWMDLAKVY